MGNSAGALQNGEGSIRLGRGVTYTLSFMKEARGFKLPPERCACVLEIRKVLSPGEINWEKMTLLMETAFGRRLDWEHTESIMRVFFLHSDYKGAAIIGSSGGLDILHLLAVDPKWQGQGIGKGIFIAVLADYKKIVWTSEFECKGSAMYARHCDGSAIVHGPFGSGNVFWRGVATDRIPEMIESIYETELG